MISEIKEHCCLFLSDKTWDDIIAFIAGNVGMAP